jgi:hypothetical protein
MTTLWLAAVCSIVCDEPFKIARVSHMPAARGGDTVPALVLCQVTALQQSSCLQQCTGCVMQRQAIMLVRSQFAGGNQCIYRLLLSNDE